MPSILDSLRRIPLLGDTIDDVSGRTGLETAAQGAKDAQAQANALSRLQWERQMAGLQEARGQTQPYLSLYDKIYGTQMAGRQAPVTGMGAGWSGPMPPGSGPPGGRAARPGQPGPNTYNGPMIYEHQGPPDATHAPIMRTGQPAPTSGSGGGVPSPGFGGAAFGGQPPPQPRPQPDALQQYLMTMGFR